MSRATADVTQVLSTTQLLTHQSRMQWPSTISHTSGGNSGNGAAADVIRLSKSVDGAYCAFKNTLCRLAHCPGMSSLEHENYIY